MVEWLHQNLKIVIRTGFIGKSSSSPENMTSIPTNQSVFNRSMTLITEFLKNKGFSDQVISTLEKETSKKKLF